RRALFRRIEEGRNRLTEITNLLDRFRLLEEHYRSDVERLQGIEEAGNLFTALSDVPCPLCGALPENHRLTEDCDGNIEKAVVAARAEIAKIEMRQSELSETIKHLKREASNFERRLPGIENSASTLSERIRGIVAPKLSVLRRSYSDLADKRSEVREAIGLYETLKELEARKKALEDEDALGEGAGKSP